MPEVRKRRKPPSPSGSRARRSARRRARARSSTSRCSTSSTESSAATASTASLTALSVGLTGVVTALYTIRAMNEAAIAGLGETGRVLTATECAGARRRAAAAHIDLWALDRAGSGEARLLWRTPHSEAWLNTWWEARDTGFHDHDGSCVGVHVLAGGPRTRRSRSGVPRQIGWLRARARGSRSAAPGSTGWTTRRAR